MDKELNDICAFVSGEMSPREFRDILFASERFEGFLANDPHLPRNGYVKGSVYYFLVQLDFDDAGDVLSAQGALMQFMERNSFDFAKTDRHEKLYDLILKAQPGYAEMPVRLIQDKILPDAGGRTGKELLSWLKVELRKRFRYVKKPPKWIQSANWPINENGPLVFLGQFDLENYFHDAATVYVFHDPSKGTCETIIQVY